MGGRGARQFGRILADLKHPSQRCLAVQRYVDPEDINSHLAQHTNLQPNGRRCQRLSQGGAGGFQGSNADSRGSSLELRVCYVTLKPCLWWKLAGYQDDPKEHIGRPYPATRETLGGTGREMARII